MDPSCLAKVDSHSLRLCSEWETCDHHDLNLTEVTTLALMS